MTLANSGASSNPKSESNGPADAYSQRIVVPDIGQFLWCATPHDRRLQADNFPKPGPHHPVLVIKLFDEVNPPRVRYIPGTTTISDSSYGWEFFVEPADGKCFEISGLSKTTRFKADQVYELPFEDRFFPNAIDFDKCTDHFLARKSNCLMGVASRRIIARACQAYTYFFNYEQRRLRR